MMRLYIGSGVALRCTWVGNHQNTEIMHASFTYVADSQAAAETWAMQQLQALHPVDDGFHQHRVQISPVSDADLAMLLRSLRDEVPA